MRAVVVASRTNRRSSPRSRRVFATIRGRKASLTDRSLWIRNRNDLPQTDDTSIPDCRACQPRFPEQSTDLFETEQPQQHVQLQKRCFHSALHQSVYIPFFLESNNWPFHSFFREIRARVCTKFLLSRNVIISVIKILILVVSRLPMIL